MIVIGAILLIIGFVLKIPILWTIGIIALAIGVVLLVAGVTATGYLYGEAYLSPEPHKVAAQSIMSAAAGHSPLYQDSALNDGALSFNAGRIVPPVDSREIFRQLKEHGEIWVIGKEVPELADAAVEVAANIDDLNLYRLQAKP